MIRRITIESWISRRHAMLRHAPGVGVQVVCTSNQRQRLLAELASQARFQPISLPSSARSGWRWRCGRREPLTLNQLQQDLAVARTTVRKDLDAFEAWLHTFALQIARR